MHFAEFGVVMMLFLVGLELQPALLWRLRAADPRARRPAGRRHRRASSRGVGDRARRSAGSAALAIGLILAMSSTAIVLQTPEREGPAQDAPAARARSRCCCSRTSRSSRSWRVFPLLATLAGARRAAHADPTARWRACRRGQQALLGARRGRRDRGRGGRFVVRPALPRHRRAPACARCSPRRRCCSSSASRCSCSSVGLSPALGTFLAGVVLADSEYRHELESDIEPFKGLLLGLFFISVGAAIDFALVAAQPAAHRSALVAA